MFPGLLKLAAMLALAFSAAAGLIRAQPYSDASWRRHLESVQACEHLCWPDGQGVTAAPGTFGFFANQPWIDEIDLYVDLNALSWTWSGAQPSWIDTSVRGMASIDGRGVRYIRIHTTLTFGDIWLGLGAPEQNMVSVASANMTGIEHSARYFQGALYVVRNPMPCAMSIRDYWHHPVALSFEGHASGAPRNMPQTSSFNLYDRPYC